MTLHEVHDRLGRVLMENLVLGDADEPRGWRRDFRGDVPVSVFSTVTAVRLLCLLDAPPYVDLHCLGRVVESFHEEGGWTTRRVGVRPEATALAIDALSRLGVSGLDDYIAELEELVDREARTSTYVLAEVLGTTARLRPHSTLRTSCARPPRRPSPDPTGLVAREDPGDRGSRPPTVHGPHSPRTHRTSTRGRCRGGRQRRDTAEAVEIGANWLAAEGRFEPIRENLEPTSSGRAHPGPRNPALTPPALVARALSLVPDPPWAVVQRTSTSCGPSTTPRSGGGRGPTATSLSGSSTMPWWPCFRGEVHPPRHLGSHPGVRKPPPRHESGPRALIAHR